MTLDFTKISKEDWKAHYARNARMSVFGEELDPAVERIDFAYLVADASSRQLLIYCTFYEMDQESLYLGFGGAFPDSRGKGVTPKALSGLFSHLASLGYKSVNYHCKNTNRQMLALGLKVGAVIIGLSHNPRSLLVEHTVNLKKEL